MIFPLRVPLQLLAIKIDLAQISCAVPRGLVIEMRRCRMTALAPGRYGPRVNFGAKFDYRSEAVPQRAIPFFRSRIRARPKRSQRAPHRRSEAHRYARPR